MWILIGGVVTASLLGSMHCVGMCGPLAIWASGAGDSAHVGDATRRGKVLGNLSLYHFGRLTTYVIAGLIAGGIGSLVDVGGEMLGFQLAAARVVGGLMIVIGLLTTLLPCGWLYLFALVAAGTGSVAMGGVTMAAFWLGTVPALTALVAGAQSLSRKFVQLIPVATAVLLIVTVAITASGRGFAELNSLSDIRRSGDVIEMDTEVD